MIVIGLVGGFVLLLVGGEMLVRGAVSAARRLGVSPLLIGLTLVGFGTSTPELVTSLDAALSGSPGIAVGNVIGSNIANILLILGIAALIKPFAAHPQAFYRDGSMVFLAALACVAVALSGEIGRIAGLGLLGLLIAYTLFTYRTERNRPDAAAADMHASEADVVKPVSGPLWLSLLLVVIGIAATIAGARFLVDAAILLAQQLGISEVLIGLTIVAVGTSLPELATSVIAALRNQADVAFGNVIGSNIYNVTGILGTTALVHPLTVPPQVLSFDLWVMLAATLAMIAATVTGWRLSRIEGALLLCAYAAYLGWLAVHAAA